MRKPCFRMPAKFVAREPCQSSRRSPSLSLLTTRVALAQTSPG
jgi:hypothetical protein